MVKCELGIKELLLWITQGTFCQRSIFLCILNWTVCNVTHPCLAESWEGRFPVIWEMLRNYRVTAALKEQLDWIACGISAGSLFTLCTPSVNRGTQEHATSISFERHRDFGSTPTPGIPPAELWHLAPDENTGDDPNTSLSHIQLQATLSGWELVSAKGKRQLCEQKSFVLDIP